MASSGRYHAKSAAIEARMAEKASGRTGGAAIREELNKKKTIILSLLPVTVEFPCLIRGYWTLYSSKKDQRVLAVDEQRMERLGQIYLGTLLTEDGLFADMPDFVSDFQEVEDLYLAAARKGYWGEKLVTAYHNLKYKYQTLRGKISSEMLEKMYQADLQCAREANETPEEREVRLRQQEEYERAQAAAERAARAAEFERMEEDRKLKEARLAAIEAEQEFLRQEKVADKAAKKAAAAAVALSQYEQDPDSFWNTPDEPKKTRRTRSSRSRK